MTDRDYILNESGVKGFFHLGEKGNKKLLLEAATSDQVIEFIKKRG